MKRRFLMTPIWLVVVFMVFTGQRCNFDSYAKQAIVSANELQDAAARAYNAAKEQEQAQGKACAIVARERNLTPSVEVCAQLGVPIPYDPEKLAALAQPINEAYDAIRALNDLREAVNAGTAPKADLQAALVKASGAILRLYEIATGIGIKVDLAGAQKLNAEVNK